mmetsp:Transcript_3701/g.11265  ORF Transcript_3701/g.11265 Transcript_3701/m.11265 type:complete len:292 (+) Transcript_3701:213-1088(+)
MRRLRGGGAAVCGRSSAQHHGRRRLGVDGGGAPRGGVRARPRHGPALRPRHKRPHRSPPGRKGLRQPAQGPRRVGVCQHRRRLPGRGAPWPWRARRGRGDAGGAGFGVRRGHHRRSRHHPDSHFGQADFEASCGDEKGGTQLWRVCGARFVGRAFEDSDFRRHDQGRVVLRCRLPRRPSTRLHALPPRLARARGSSGADGPGVSATSFAHGRRPRAKGGGERALRQALQDDGLCDGVGLPRHLLRRAQRRALLLARRASSRRPRPPRAARCLVRPRPRRRRARRGHPPRRR